MTSSDTFEKGKTYSLELEFKTEIYWSGDGIRSGGKLDGEYYAFKTSYATIDGVECNGVLEERSYSRREYYDEIDYYHYPKTALSFTFTITTDGDYPLLGSVSYKGEARFGETFQATGIKLTTDIPVYKLNSQWQVEEDGVWKDIAGETDLRIDISGVDKRSLVGKNIRIALTTEGYRDGIYGEPQKVGKRYTGSTAPDAPELSYYNEGTLYRFYIDNYNSDEQSYHYMIYDSLRSPITTVPVTIDSDTFTIDRLNYDQIVQVSTGFKFTEWQESSTYFEDASVVVPARITGTSATSLIYPEYDTLTPTVYIPIGESLDIKYMISPPDAKNNLPIWKSVTIDSELIVDVRTGASFEAEPGEGILTLTAGDTATTVMVSAYKSEEQATPWYYGNDYSAMGCRITVVIYDPNNSNSIPTPDTSRTIELREGESYEMSTTSLKNLPLVKPGISAYLDPDDFKYEAAIYKTTVHGYEWVEANDFISVTNTDDGICINADHVGESDGSVHIFAVRGTNIRRDIASINVTVVSNGVNVSGGVTAYGDATDSISLKLLQPNGNPVNEQSLSGDATNYSIDKVVNGKYTMVVSKKAHVTKSYELSVGTEDVVQDIKLNLYGDADGNGSISMSDVLAVMKYVANWDVEIPLDVCDVDLDGNITLADIIRILKKVAAWDITLGEK